MKRIKYHVQRFILKAKMRSAAAEIEAAEMRIAQDKLMIDNLLRYRIELQSDAYWLEKNNFQMKRMAV